MEEKEEIEFEKCGYAALSNSKKTLKIKIDEEIFYISTRKLIKVLQEEKDWTAVVRKAEIDTSGLSDLLDEIDKEVVGGEDEG